MPNKHFFIKLSDDYRTGIIPECAKNILNFYSKKSISKRKDWVKQKEFYITNNENQTHSKNISYSILTNYMRSYGSFSHEEFGLYPYQEFWLDYSINMTIDSHIYDENEALTFSIQDQKQKYGENYPITPQLDREGHLYSSMQDLLINRIIYLRKKLVDESNLALSTNWIFDLRTLIVDVVSLVDITLHQLYIKAQYDPLPTWTFDKSILGEKYGKRMVDKFKWITKITGNSLDNARDEKDSFNNLKQIRNHLMHFDPPSLVLPLEEISMWMNQIIDVAFLLKKMREKMNVSSSTAMTNFLLQKDVLFIPKSNCQNRLPLNSSRNGYRSSYWQEPIDENNSSDISGSSDSIPTISETDETPQNIKPITPNKVINSKGFSKRKE